MSILTLHFGGAIITLLVCVITWVGILGDKKVYLFLGIKTLGVISLFQIITGIGVALITETQSLLGVCARLGIYVSVVAFTFFSAKTKLFKLQSLGTT